MIEPDVNNAAEPSAAAVVEPQFNPSDQYTWSPEQREHWNKTGKPPEPPKKQEAEPAAAPAKEATSEPEGKSEAEPETAPKQGKKERKPGEKLSADERIAQLTAKVKELEERGRSRETAPKPSPEPVPQAAAPKRPNPLTWAGTAEEYEVAAEAWDAHLKSQALQEFQRNETQRAINEKTKSQLDEVKARYPDADNQRMKAALDDLVLSPKVHIPGVIQGMLSDTEVLVDLMYVMSDEDTRSNFIETVTQNPGKAIRVLAQMERDITAAKAEPPAKSDPKPPAEQKPRAPKPPSEVGGRGTADEDALRVAARSNDFRAFETEQNRRKFARSA